MKPSPELRRRLKAMPKVDLHCHLDGSLRPATVLDMAKRLKVRLPADNVEDLIPFVTVSPACRSLREFLDVFHVLYPLLRDPVSAERAAYELCEDCAAENIRHVEVRDAPLLHAHAKFSAGDYVEAVLKGLARGLKDFGVSSGFIVGLFRAHSPKENRVAFEAMKRMFKPSNGLSRPGVVGMDLCGDEARFPTMQFAEFYEEAEKLGIPTTCHAGETVGTENLRAALALGVRRIGHGTHLFEDQRLLAEAVRRRVPLEIGITSNVRTKAVADLASHPAKRFHDAGLPITLNTDDRGIMGIDLTGEYAEALKLGFTVSDLASLVIGSTDHLFLPPADRERLRKDFTARMKTALKEAAR